MVAEIQTVYHIWAERLKTDIPAPWSLCGPSSFPRSKIWANVMKHGGAMFDKIWGTNGSLDPRKPICGKRFGGMFKLETYMRKACFEVIVGEVQTRNLYAGSVF